VSGICNKVTLQITPHSNRAATRSYFIYLFIYLFIQFINQQWHRSTSKEHTGRMANTGLTNHLCAAT